MPDIFISYTHADNVKLAYEKQGWVDIFLEELQVRLDTLGGRKFEIFLDPKMHSSDMLDDRIADEISRSRVLVAVISPTYLNSKWCHKEVELFCDAAQGSGGLKVGTRSRMFQAFKLPVDRDVIKSIRHELGSPTGEKFFRRNADGSSRELDPRLGGEDLVEFRQKITKFAGDLCVLLKEMREPRDSQHVKVAGAVIEVNGEAGERSLRELPRGARVVAGRGEDADLVFAVPEVSRAHAEFTADDSGLMVRDLESKNGTFVNGARISRRTLLRGDVVRLSARGPTITIVRTPADEVLTIEDVTT